MPDLTEEEYDTLDEKWTKNPARAPFFAFANSGTGEAKDCYNNDG